MAEDSLWSEAERRAWLPPEQITIPGWAEKYRYLSRRQTSRPGYWRNDNAPATVGLMVVCEVPGIRQVTVLKHSQGGWSEAVRNVLGKKAHLEPDPALLVLPNRDKGRSIISDRILPLLQDTPPLRELATGRAWDQTKSEILLRNGFQLRLGYSGSLDSVSSDPARFVINDERSKFQEDPKASVADSIEARTASYENALIINLSTPLSDPDPTEQLYNSADIKLQFFVTCPHCGRDQVLTFERLRWEPKKEEVPDKNERARLIRHNRSAWFECENPACGGRMTDQHRLSLIRNGYWATDDRSWRIDTRGNITGTRPIGTSVGMHAPAWTSVMPMHAWSEIAAKFVAAEGDSVKLKGVYNELLAAVYHTQTQSQRTGQFSDKCRPDPETGFTPPPAMKVPIWASRILLTVDTQKDHFWFVVRAWGHGFRSRRLHHGRVQTFDELDYLANEAMWEYEPGAPFAPLPIAMVGIDSGGGKMGLDASRTHAVYQWCNKDPARRKPLKGMSEPSDRPIHWSRVTYQPPDGRAAPYQTILWRVDSHYFNDLLAAYAETQVSIVNPKTGEIEGKEDQWQLNDVDDEEYNRHLAAMHKVVLRSRGRDVERWIPKTAGARVDLRMCEVYQIALAHGPAMCGTLPTLQVMLQQHDAPRTPTTQQTGIRMPDGRPFLATRR